MLDLDLPTWERIIVDAKVSMVDIGLTLQSELQLSPVTAPETSGPVETPTTYPLKVAEVVTLPERVTITAVSNGQTTIFMVKRNRLVIASSVGVCTIPL